MKSEITTSPELEQTRTMAQIESDPVYAMELAHVAAEKRENEAWGLMALPYEELEAWLHFRKDIYRHARELGSRAQERSVRGALLSGDSFEHTREIERGMPDAHISPDMLRIARQTTRTRK